MPSIKWSVLYSKNNVFLLVVFLCATFLKTQKTESVPFCGNTRVGFWNLSLLQGKPVFTTPQKWTPHGNVARLQGKPHFGTEMLLKPMVFYTFRMRTLGLWLVPLVAPNDPSEVHSGTISGWAAKWLQMTLLKSILGPFRAGQQNSSK